MMPMRKRNISSRTEPCRTPLTQEETKVNTETELADLEEKISGAEKYRNEKNSDKDASNEEKKSLGTDCKWVKTHFDSRREKRKTEIQGLVDAKGFLAAGGSGII